MGWMAAEGQGKVRACRVAPVSSLEKEPDASALRSVRRTLEVLVSKITPLQPNYARVSSLMGIPKPPISYGISAYFMEGYGRKKV